MIFLLESFVFDSDGASVAVDPKAKAVEELTNDVKKELGRNQTIRVNAWEHHEGGSWHIEAEYRTLLVEAQAIERDMMDAYKKIYTSKCPRVEGYYRCPCQTGGGVWQRIYRRPHLPNRDGCCNGS